MKNHIIPILAIAGSISVTHAEVKTTETKSSGFYGNAFAGVAVFDDVDFDVPAGKYDDTAEIDTGLSAGLLIGYDFGKYRIEGEFTHMSGDIDSLEVVDIDSEFTSNSLMLNALLDFEFDKILLSVGAGVGASDQSYDEMENSGITVSPDVDDTVFAYQGIIRGTYAFSEKASFGLSYRYLATSDFSDSGMINLGGPPLPSDVDIDGAKVSLFEVFFSYDF